MTLRWTTLIRNLPQPLPRRRNIFEWPKTCLPTLHVRAVYFPTSILPIYLSSTYLDYVCFSLAHAWTHHSSSALNCLPLRCISVGTLFCIPFEFYCLSDHMLFTCRIHFLPSLLYVFYHCCSFSLVMPRAAYLFFLILRTFGDVGRTCPSQKCVLHFFHHVYPRPNFYSMIIVIFLIFASLPPRK
jgi:hypothetical protein